MRQENYEVVKERFDLVDKSLYYIQGSWPKEAVVTAMLDNRELQVEIEKEERVSALERTSDFDLQDGIRICMTVHFPENLGDYKKLVIYAGSGSDKFTWFSASARQLARKQGKPQYFIESIDIEEVANICRVRGWAAFSSPVEIRLETKDRKPIPCKFEMTKRVDVQNQYKEVEVEEKCGFFFELKYPDKLKEFYIVFDAEGGRTLRMVHLQRAKRIIDQVGIYYRKGFRYLKKTWTCCSGRKGNRKGKKTQQRSSGIF